MLKVGVFAASNHQVGWYRPFHFIETVLLYYIYFILFAFYHYSNCTRSRYSMDPKTTWAGIITGTSNLILSKRFVPRNLN